MVDAKPHCGLTASCSSGMNRAASLIRRSRSSLRSSAGRLELTRPKTTVLPLGTRRRRLEGAGALVVVFEQEAIDGEFMEEALGNSVVAAFGVPVAAIVAAAEMDGEGDAGLTGRREAGVVGVKRSCEHLRRIDTQFLLHPGCPLRIEIVAVARRIDLEVRDAARGQVADVGGHDLGDGM